MLNRDEWSCVFLVLKSINDFSSLSQVCKVCHNASNQVKNKFIKRFITIIYCPVRSIESSIDHKHNVLHGPCAYPDNYPSPEKKMSWITTCFWFGSKSKIFIPKQYEGHNYVELKDHMNKEYERFYGS